MGIKWTESQIKDLLRKAKDLYEVEIPLAAEISHLLHFLWEMQIFANKKNRFNFKIKAVVFSWWGMGKEISNDIEIPEEIAWKVFHEARALLDTKCNRLIDLMGMDKRTFRRKQN